MIAYEIQLRYVIRDKIQSKKKKISLKQNSVLDKTQEKIFFVGKKILLEKNR